jgi:[ribosomal protein S5]-alanine N-acetyltransferase
LGRKKTLVYVLLSIFHLHPALETEIMKSIHAQGFALRPHQESDKNFYIRFPRESEFYRLIGYKIPHDLTREEEADIWYTKKNGVTHSWAIEIDSKCIGSVFIHSIEAENRRARFAIEIFDSSYWGRGVGRAATENTIKYAFEILHLHRLDLRVLTINERAIRCYEHCGFKREGIQRDTLFCEGEWYSDLWMSILEAEYNSISASSAIHE